MRKKAFTLIELILVIVIFGIIATMGAEMIAKTYDNYFRSSSINRLEAQAEIALEQIAKRLSYRVRGSEAVVRAGGFIQLSSQKATDTTLAWISVSNESFQGEWNSTQFVPGWSGVIDFSAVATLATAKTLATPGSRLDYAHNIIQALTERKVGLGAGNNPPALIPKTIKNTEGDFIGKFYSNVDSDYTIKVRRRANNVFVLDANESTPTYLDTATSGGKGLPPEYSLAHTAYALVPEGPANDFNLTLQYNYQPWNGNGIDDGSEAILAEHVSTFRFKKDAGSIRIKLCLQDANQNASYNMSACKETVVF